MQLKPYQAETLAILRRFLETARYAGAAAAFNAITSEPDQKNRLGPLHNPYRPHNGMAETPYICLRLPTGGGKTILAAHTVALARDAWMEQDYPLVLWLVPSNAIRTQTAEALKKPGHPYRAALDEAFEGRVRIFDIADFTQLRPHDLAQNCCVVVATIQTLRVQNTEGRRIYAHHEEMESHFSAVPPNTPGLETNDHGKIKFSFANLLHLLRPLMIVDEAHNAVSGLSSEMQSRVNPCAIVEFTATPRPQSNILHTVSAQELKDAEMIKLPIILAEQQTWQAAVTDSIAARASLAQAAARDPRYIRPIILFQAQNKDQDVTAEILRQHLIDIENLPPNRIAIVTGDQRELDGIDLFNPACPIEAIITVQALKEGWDCSFAYVFCSVARIRSATDVEQLLGRVLRMPYAQRRPIPELNRAYAFVSEPEFGAAAKALTDKLVAMGFDRTEAEDNVVHVQQPLGAGTLFNPATPPLPVFHHPIHAPAETLAAIEAAGAKIITTPTGETAIELPAQTTPEITQAVAAALPVELRTQFAEARARFEIQTLSLAQRGIRIVVPALAAESQGELVFADTCRFFEDHEWTLASHPHQLSEIDFAIRDTGNAFEIDLHGNRIQYAYVGDTRQTAFDIPAEGWTDAFLAAWLARQLRAHYLNPADLLGWASNAVYHLTLARNLPIASLMRCKFVLERALRAKIEAARDKERQSVYQSCLFGANAHPSLTFDHAFTFEAGMYDGAKRYKGPWRPTKHFFGPTNLPGFDGAPDGEEFRCAQAIDSLPQVETWIRNVANHPRSFSLPLAGGRYYPDFIARLTDGRLFIIEYKGEHLIGAPKAIATRAIGHLYERTSGGKCLYRMLNGPDTRNLLAAYLGDHPTLP